MENEEKSWHWETENVGLVLGVVGAAFVVLLACCCLGWWV
jgi:hypothetical protein